MPTIRVYPQYAAPGALANRTGAVSAATYFNSRLQTQRQVANLQLGYERALANERIERARLEERMRNPYLSMNTGGVGGVLGNQLLAAQLMAGTLNAGMPMARLPIGLAGSGQMNFTNQTSTGGNQTVTNSNVNNVSHQFTQPVHGGWYAPPIHHWGGGGLLSSLLGALI